MTAGVIAGMLLRTWALMLEAMATEGCVGGQGSASRARLGTVETPAKSALAPCISGRGVPTSSWLPNPRKVLKLLDYSVCYSILDAYGLISRCSYKSMEQNPHLPAHFPDGQVAFVASPQARRHPAPVV